MKIISTSIFRVTVLIISALNIFLLKKWRNDSQSGLAVCIRSVAERLGGGFIKFGQVLSSRPEIFGKDGCIELSKLLDFVPPQNWSATNRCLIKSGINVDSDFLKFNINPIGSASIAQVYFATLHSGESVVVKVKRSGIEKILLADMSIISAATFIAFLLGRFSKSERAAILRELRMRISHETDFYRERLSQAAMIRQMNGNPDLHATPVPIVSMCSADVLVMMWSDGASLSSLARKNSSNRQTRRNLCERVWISMLSQILHGPYFHGDPHAGNILIEDRGGEPKIVWIDYGIIGYTTKYQRGLIYRLFSALHTANIDAALETLSDLGLVGARSASYEVRLDLVYWLECTSDSNSSPQERSFGQLLLLLRPLFSKDALQTEFLTRLFRTLYVTEAALNLLDAEFNSQKFIRETFASHENFSENRLLRSLHEILLHETMLTSIFVNHLRHLRSQA